MNKILLLALFLPVTGLSQTPGGAQLAIGRPAPPLHLTPATGAGKAYDVTSLKGQVVVLEFWATWCASCIKAMPHMNELSAKFAGKPVKFISVSVESDDPVGVKQFAKKGLMDTEVVIGSRDDLLSNYGTSAIPETIILDKNGVVAAVTYPLDVNEHVIDAVLEGKETGLPNWRGKSSTGKPVESLPQDKPVDSISFKLEKLAKKPTGGGMQAGPRGWTLNGIESRKLLEYVFRVTEPRLEVHGTLPQNWYNVKAEFPEGTSIDDRYKIAQSLLPASMGVTVKTVEQEVDAIVLTCPNGLTENLRKVDKLGHGGSGEGVSAGDGMDVKWLSQSLEPFWHMPIVDETKLEGRYSWSLTYKPRDYDSLVKELAGMGIVAKVEKRKIAKVVVETKSAGGIS